MKSKLRTVFLKQECVTRSVFICLGLVALIGAIVILCDGGVFGKQSLGPLHCGPPPLPEQVRSRTRGHPFSRSYGAIVPSSLTMVDPIASVCSTHPPVSVCGTGAHAPA